MRRFLTPWWLLSHLFAVVMVVVFVNLGFWQLHRLDERRDRNDVLREVLDAEPVPIGSVLGTDPPDEAAVTVAGDYVAGSSFLVANRTYDSQAGLWLATPVRLADGRLVVVSRGWVPRAWASGDDPREVVTPTGPIEVLGRSQASVDGGRIGTDSAFDLPEVSRLDVEVVEELLGLELEDTWVQLVEQAPPVDDLPIPVPPPGLDEGPHLSYAFQWFFFAAATVVAYVLILRRRAGEPAADPESPRDSDPDVAPLAP